MLRDQKQKATELVLERKPAAHNKGMDASSDILFRKMQRSIRNTEAYRGKPGIRTSQQDAHISKET
jgi:hypothetical protein